MLQLSRKRSEKIILDLRKLEFEEKIIIELLETLKRKYRASDKVLSEVAIAFNSSRPSTEFITIQMCGVDEVPGYAVIGIDAPMDVTVKREEILDAKTADYIQQGKKRRSILPVGNKSSIPSS